jgi:hypothetical protein
MANIIIMSDHPSLLTSSGRLSSFFARQLKKDGHNVNIISVSEYKPDHLLDINFKEYIYNDIYICDILHFFTIAGNVQKLENHIKSLNPDVIFSIGETLKFTFMNEIKKHLNHTFKWIYIGMPYYIPIEREDLLRLDSLNYMVFTNNITLNIEPFFNYKIIPCGYDENIFKNKTLKDKNKFSIFLNVKNVFESNISESLSGINIFYNEMNFSHDDIDIFINSNYDDKGFYKYKHLYSTYQDLPIQWNNSTYSSYFRSLSDDKMNEMYNKSCIYLDPSYIHGCNMSSFEAIANFCVPIVNKNSILHTYLRPIFKDLQLDYCSLTYINNTIINISFKDQIAWSLKKAYKHWTNTQFKKEMSHFNKISQKLTFSNFYHEVLSIYNNLINDKKLYCFMEKLKKDL